MSLSLLTHFPLTVEKFHYESDVKISQFKVQGRLGWPCSACHGKSQIPQPVLISQCISHSVVPCSHSSTSTSECCGDAAPCPGSSCSCSVAVGNVLSQSVGKLSDLNFALYFHAIWNSLNICRPFSWLLLLDCTDICEIYLVPFLICCLHYKYKSRQCFWREINVIVVVVVVINSVKDLEAI